MTLLDPQDLQELVDLVDEWDRYAASEGPPYFRSPFAERVNAALVKHGRRTAKHEITDASTVAMGTHPFADAAHEEGHIAALRAQIALLEWEVNACRKANSLRAGVESYADEREIVVRAEGYPPEARTDLLLLVDRIAEARQQADYTKENYQDLWNAGCDVRDERDRLRAEVERLRPPDEVLRHQATRSHP